jgi:hypothetical protein
MTHPNVSDTYLSGNTLPPQFVYYIASAKNLFFCKFPLT